MLAKDLFPEDMAEGDSDERQFDLKQIQSVLGFLKNKLSPEDLGEVLFRLRRKEINTAQDSALRRRVNEGVSRQRLADYEARAAFDRAHGLGKPARILGN